MALSGIRRVECSAEGSGTGRRSVLSLYDDCPDKNWVQRPRKGPCAVDDVA